jgi:hypothetical protein
LVGKAFRMGDLAEAQGLLPDGFERMAGSRLEAVSPGTNAEGSHEPLG